MNLVNFFFQGNQFSSDDDNELIRIQIGAYDYDTGKSKCRRKNQNRIVSTKYSLLTFIPQNLFEVCSKSCNYNVTNYRNVSLLAISKGC